MILFMTTYDNIEENLKTIGDSNIQKDKKGVTCRKERLKVSVRLHPYMPHDSFMR